MGNWYAVRHPMAEWLDFAEIPSMPGTCGGKDMTEPKITPYSESDDAVAADLW